MLKIAFVGHENEFTYFMCDWLAENTDLSLIIWTEKMWWAYGHGWGRIRRVLAHFSKRVRKRGWLRAADEFLYFVLYWGFLHRRETKQVHKAVASAACRPRKPLTEITQVWPTDIRSPELVELLRSKGIDAIFSMCIDVYLPKELIESPKYGSFLWHEGITPEYRGVHSPFWALYRDDYDNIGYTFLRMNAKLDAGEIFAQGKVRDADFTRAWHSYLGHKAVLDSLPDVKRFLRELENGQPASISRDGAVDAYYSYATGSALLWIVARRLFRRILRK
jgi:hypothetical protein